MVLERGKKIHIVTTEKQVKNFKVQTIISKKQHDALKNKENVAHGMDYEHLKEFMHYHKRDFIKNKHKRHQINVLTRYGWRTAKAFDSYRFNFYDPTLYYNDEAELDVVYAVQLIEFP